VLAAPLKIHFTTEVRPELARCIALVAPDGTRAWPGLSSDSEIRDIEFEPIFKESATYKVISLALMADTYLAVLCKTVVGKKSGPFLHLSLDHKA